MPNLVLASSSPRRRELLQMLGVPFTIEVSAADESFEPGMHPEEVVRELAIKKATAVANRIANTKPRGTTDEATGVDRQGSHNDPTLVLAADTIVVHEGTILGKPKHREEAIDMLSRLQGTDHEVFTGVCLMRVPDMDVESKAERTRVTMGPLTREEIEEYVDSGEPMDKAGAYGIQGYGAVLIEGIEGDYFTVVGLPLYRVSSMLKPHGFRLWGGPQPLSD